MEVFISWVLERTGQILCNFTNNLPNRKINIADGKTRKGILD
jgi:hypothetical protein